MNIGQINNVIRELCNPGRSRDIREERDKKELNGIDRHSLGLTGNHLNTEYICVVEH